VCAVWSGVGEEEEEVEEEEEEGARKGRVGGRASQAQ
jgi:hypothetical protein